MNKELLDKYFAGDCTSEEIRQIEQWLGTHEALPDASMPVGNTVKRNIWKPLIRRIDDEQGRTAGLSSIFRKIAVAATVLGVIVVTGYTIFASLQQHPAPVAWKTVSNPGGKMVKITLADNSTVQLNGGTTLEYPTAFEGPNRQVKLLSGEAFFNVNKGQQPFLVKTEGEGDILVLGTSFNIKHTPHKAELVITLTSGKILFKAPDIKSQYLLPGQQLLYNLETKRAQAPVVVDTVTVLNWANNIIEFNDTPIEDVFATLESRFGVVFTIDQQPAPQTINGKFTGNTLQEILLLIEKTTDIKFKQLEKEVIVMR
ncbi:FecR family protein [uncultured Chitinophaga sp.]|uniref:FecR family protein n=1 Tax=uncultured Chitinophaga sp. TaxID=339340 RepID=UPI0025FA80BD|nr:FecR domain-containing protein [uncultured Chitinophaga sp.]